MMKFDRWDRIGSLFMRAVELTPEEREKFLQSECNGDDEMIAEIRSLLAADDEANAKAFMETAPEWSSEMLGGEEETPEEEDELLGAEVGAYKVLRRIGRGGMGVVYEGVDTRLGRSVALKFVLPELSAHEKIKRRFIREARAASALDHKNICTVFDIGETEDGRVFISMAYYEGQTLKERIRQGSIPLEECIDIGIQISEGLERAHDVGIIHRDLKPANLVVTDRGEVKILDFGIAKFEGLSRITKSGARLGTAAYMSPESMTPRADIDLRTDVWSLGVVLYEMVTGVQPFRGESEIDVIRAILNDDPVPMQRIRSEVTQSLEDVVAGLLAKNPDDRFRSMEFVHFRLLDTMLR